MNGRDASGRPAHRPAGRGGQATAEAALVLPLLLFAILGMIAVGYGLYASTVVVLAAHQAGRQGAVYYGDPGLSEAEAREKTRAVAERTLNALAGGTRDVDVARDGDDVVVTVTYEYRIFVPWMEAVFPDGKARLRHTATYRIEPQ